MQLPCDSFFYFICFMGMIYYHPPTSHIDRALGDHQPSATSPRATSGRLSQTPMQRDNLKTLESFAREAWFSFNFKSRSIEIMENPPNQLVVSCCFMANVYKDMCAIHFGVASPILWETTTFPMSQAIGVYPSWTRDLRTWLQLPMENCIC